MSWKRDVLKATQRDAVANALQPILADLIDLALQLKQAHWCVKGARFIPIHEKLDEIIDEVRGASDEVAERISTLGVAPMGHAQVVAESTRLDRYPETFVDDSKTATIVADRLDKTVQGLRTGIETVGDHDLITEDLLIGISAGLEKQMWMMQAQEGEAN